MPVQSPPSGRGSFLPRLKIAVVGAAVVLALVLLFLNWATLSTSVTVHLIFLRFEAPLWLLVVALVGLAGIAFVAAFASLEAATLRNDRRILRSLEALEDTVGDLQTASLEELRGLSEEVRRLRGASGRGAGSSSE
ncbi:MAG: hypothetical protein R3190_05165 [Thermoanaerobaculia bacterium]|nr:hypothetical protein [Thermoanaerobaculia bacterium]